MCILFSSPVISVTKLLLLLVISDCFSIFLSCELILSEGDQLLLLFLFRRCCILDIDYLSACNLIMYC